MANHLRQQIREAVVAALTGLSTTGSKVYESRVYPMQDTNLPGLRVYTSAERVEIASKGGAARQVARTLDLVVEICVKSSSFDDTSDQIQKEVEVALAGAQNAGGAKYIQLRETEDELGDEAETPVCMRRCTFEVLYYSGLGTPDVAL